MLIRSQDRRLLLSIETNIVSTSYNGQGKIIAYSTAAGDSDAYIELGYYGTSERALEVIDAISREYCAPNMHVPHVFQMPEK